MSETMTIEEAIRRAVKLRDSRAAGAVVDTLRAVGWTYDKILARVQSLHPDVTPGDWDHLLAECDERESAS